MKPLPGTHWRHYKSTGGDDHTYEVLDIVKHSETGEEMVLYKPLYDVSPDSWAYNYSAIVRPLTLWYDDVEYHGVTQRRFTEI